MCEPVSMGIAAGSMLVGAGMSAYGNYKAGQEQARAMEQNASMRQVQARDEMQRASHEARQVEIESRNATSTAYAKNAGSGVRSSSMDKAAESAAISGMLDADQIRANAARTAWGYRSEAKELKRQAKAARSAGILGAVSTGLSGAGSAAISYHGATR